MESVRHDESIILTTIIKCPSVIINLEAMRLWKGSHSKRRTRTTARCMGERIESASWIDW